MLIHVCEPSDTLFAAIGACRYLLDLPKIDEDSPALDSESVFECILYCTQIRRSKIAALHQAVGRAVAPPRRNQSCYGCTAIERVVQRTLRPVQRFIFADEGRLHQYEDAKIDGVLT